MPLGPIPGVTHAQANSPSEAIATAQKIGSGPATVAAPPSTGPSSTPTIAADIAEPISWPRLAPGEARTSHASAPAQVNELPRPCRKRAPSSNSTLPAKANATLATVIVESPSNTARLAP